MWSLKIMKIIIVIFSLIFLTENQAEANIIGPEVTINNKGEIIVDTYFHNTDDFEDFIRTGITKDITIAVQIRKIKDFWPDKIIKEKDFAITIKYNNLKETFTVTTSNGTDTYTKIFNDYLHMVKSTFTIKGFHMANTNGLPQGRYFVMVIMESHRVRLPPVIRHLLFFVPEKEFTIERKSIPFIVTH
jgi:hypothetical protein